MYLDALTMAYKACQEGACGVDMGRNIFQSESPRAMIQAVRKVVHEGESPKAAHDFFRSQVKAKKPRPPKAAPARRR